MLLSTQKRCTMRGIIPHLLTSEKRYTNTPPERKIFGKQNPETKIPAPKKITRQQTQANDDRTLSFPAYITKKQQKILVEWKKRREKYSLRTIVVVVFSIPPKYSNYSTPLHPSSPLLLYVTLTVLLCSRKKTSLCVCVTQTIIEWVSKSLTVLSLKTYYLPRRRPKVVVREEGSGSTLPTLDFDRTPVGWATTTTTTTTLETPMMDVLACATTTTKKRTKIFSTRRHNCTPQRRDKAHWQTTDG